MSAAMQDALTDAPRIPALWEALRADLEHVAKNKGSRYPSVVGLIDVLSLPGTWAVILFRLANTAHYKGLRPLSRFLYFINVVLFGAELHPTAIVQPGLLIPHPVGVGMAGECRIGSGVTLFHCTVLGGLGDPKRPGQPILGNDVILFDNASVFGPVHVGDRSIIGTRAIVVDDVEPDMFVFGARKSQLVRPLSEMGLEGHATAGNDDHQHDHARSSGGQQNTETDSIGGTGESFASNGQAAKAV
jgi:serine O-acetyltransferase